MAPPPLSKPTMKESYVYLLRSLKDNGFYLGWTTDLNHRLEVHNTRQVFSTKSRAPFELIHYEIYPSPELAKLRERKLKKNPNMYSYFKKHALKKEVVGWITGISQ